MCIFIMIGIAIGMNLATFHIMKKQDKKMNDHIKSLIYIGEHLKTIYEILWSLKIHHISDKREKK